MLTLDLVKAHLKLDPADTSEDGLLTAYLAATVGTFRTESKRRWPVVGEPALATASEPTTTPPGLTFARYVDPAVLNPDEQAMADQYILLMLGHWYENRQEVVADVRAVAVQVPMAAQYLMNLLREPTL